MDWTSPSKRVKQGHFIFFFNEDPNFFSFFFLSLFLFAFSALITRGPSRTHVVGESRPLLAVDFSQCRRMPDLHDADERFGSSEFLGVSTIVSAVCNWNLNQVPQEAHGLVGETSLTLTSACAAQEAVERASQQLEELPEPAGCQGSGGFLCGLPLRDHDSLLHQRSGWSHMIGNGTRCHTGIHTTWRSSQSAACGCGILAVFSKTSTAGTSPISPRFATVDSRRSFPGAGATNFSMFSSTCWISRVSPIVFSTACTCVATSITGTGAEHALATSRFKVVRVPQIGGADWRRFCVDHIQRRSTNFFAKLDGLLHDLHLCWWQVRNGSGLDVNGKRCQNCLDLWCFLELCYGL